MAAYLEGMEPETQRWLDETALQHLSDKQRADLEAFPLSICKLDNETLIAAGVDAKEKRDSFVAAIMAFDDDIADTDEAIAILKGEYLWRNITSMIADECRRRIDGKAPRAKGLN
jgi:hypothetical protein